MNPLKKILELLNKDIIETEDFNEASKLFFEHKLSFNELQLNLKDSERKKGLENLIIFADHLVLNKITSIDKIENREFIEENKLKNLAILGIPRDKKIYKEIIEILDDSKNWNENNYNLMIENNATVIHYKSDDQSYSSYYNEKDFENEDVASKFTEVLTFDEFMYRYSKN